MSQEPPLNKGNSGCRRRQFERQMLKKIPACHFIMVMVLLNGMKETLVPIDQAGRIVLPKDVRDELKEGDQVLVKVLAVEGNRIRLSRKAILKEQRAKMGGGEPGPDGSIPSNGDVAGEPALTIEGGGDFPDDEPNFNRDAVAGVAGGGGERPSGDRPDRGGDRGRGGRPGGGGGRGRGRGGRPGGGGGGRGGHGGPRH